ncbi:MAG: hypothetical protein V4534_07110 [Myxococcota bacterium]
MKFFIFSLLLISIVGCFTVSNDADIGRRGRHNPFLSIVKPILPARVHGAYDHTLYYDDRSGGDCQPYCPQVDIWQYQYLEHTSPLPISTQQAFWKSPQEARVIAFSLFGQNPIYYQGLLDFLKSFKTLKRVNHIQDEIWGLETFTPRVYVPKRNPFGVFKDMPLEGELLDYQIKALADAGCEIVFVDNGLKKATKDATFWRFMIAAEPMPEGQKIRYLLRDADWIMTGAEAFAIGEWMASKHQYHRAHLIPICLGPLTASWWGGSHTGHGDFTNLKDFISFFPYRLNYGDDELFLRDAVWPKMKHSGSVMTHIIKRNWVSSVMNPYAGSCEEPTKRYCNAINPRNHCEDVELPLELDYPGTKLGMRTTLKELEKYPEYFDMKLNTKRGRQVMSAFKVR